MNSFIDFFDIIKKKTFIQMFTSIPYNTGVSNRFQGKGTNPADRKTEPTDYEKAEAKAGWELLKKQGDKFFKSL